MIKNKIPNPAFSIIDKYNTREIGFSRIVTVSEDPEYVRFGTVLTLRIFGPANIEDGICITDAEAEKLIKGLRNFLKSKKVRAKMNLIAEQTRDYLINGTED